MLQLILSLLAIALMAVTVTAAVSSINPAAVLAAQESTRMQRGFEDLEAGYQAFVGATQVEPTSMADLAPAYVFLPPSSVGTHWSFGVDAGGMRYVCLSGSFTDVQVTALQRLRQDFSPQAYFIGPGCGVAGGEGRPAAAYLLVRPKAGAVVASLPLGGAVATDGSLLLTREAIGIVYAPRSMSARA